MTLPMRFFLMFSVVRRSTDSSLTGKLANPDSCLRRSATVIP